MSQKIYFSGVGAPEVWKPMRWIEVSKRMQDFLAWDAGPDLAQATWEWPLKPRKLGFAEYACFDLSRPRDHWLAVRIREHLSA